jgi:hypothetical protein
VAAPQKRKSALEPFRASVLRIQFVVGIGFLAWVAGGILASGLKMRLEPRLEAVGPWLAYLIESVISRLWILVVLPAVAWVAARILPLKPLSTALGAAVTGELFGLMLLFVSQGWVGLYGGWGSLALRIGTLALGILFTLRAVRAGRAAAQRAQEAAAKIAEAKKKEYAEFAAEAERLAARSEAKANPDAPGTDPQPR